MELGLTFRRDAIKDLIVEILTCAHCQAQSFKIYYPDGDDVAHLYCNGCKVVYCDHEVIGRRNEE